VSWFKHPGNSRIPSTKLSSLKDMSLPRNTISRRGTLKRKGKMKVLMNMKERGGAEVNPDEQIVLCDVCVKFL